VYVYVNALYKSCIIFIHVSIQFLFHMSVLTCRLFIEIVSIHMYETTLPFSRTDFKHLNASYLNIPSHWHRQVLRRMRHLYGTPWTGYKCRDITYDNDQIYGPATALTHILTPTLHRHVETLWSPLHKPHS